MTCLGPLESCFKVALSQSLMPLPYCWCGRTKLSRYIVAWNSGTVMWYMNRLLWWRRSCVLCHEGGKLEVWKILAKLWVGKLIRSRGIFSDSRGERNNKDGWARSRTVDGFDHEGFFLRLGNILLLTILWTTIRYVLSASFVSNKQTPFFKRRQRTGPVRVMMRTQVLKSLKQHQNS